MMRLLRLVAGIELLLNEARGGESTDAPFQTASLVIEVIYTACKLDKI
jgi:hypothetical protein